MKRIELAFWLIVFCLMSCYSQEKKTTKTQQQTKVLEKGETIEESANQKFIYGGTAKEFLDGYAWQFEKGNQAYIIHSAGNKIYYFYPIGADDSKEYEKKPEDRGEYFFFPRSSKVYDEALGYDKSIPLPKDSIYSDYPIRYPIIENNNMVCEIYYDMDLIYKNGEPDFSNTPSFILGFNIKEPNRVLFDRSFMRSATTNSYWKRITAPPKFVQDFIIELKKDVLKPILADKATIYSAPNKPTKMYLVKGDEVECLEEKESWYKIRYYGKKTIEGWVKKEDILE